MSVLPGGRPLQQALPDLDELLDDPEAYLTQAPLALGPRRMYGLALLFAVPGVAFLLACAFGKPTGEKVAMGVGFLVGACVWLGWSLLLRGHELVLHADGVEVTCRDGTVWAPWALFHVEGQPFVAESDSPRAGLILPVNPRAVPYVELRRGGTVAARGTQVRGPQWFFTGRGEVVLPARYEIAAQDVGELLLWVGGRLGRELPREPPPELTDEPPDDPPEPDPAGWVTLPLTRLWLPPCCARCGGPRDDTIKVPVRARGDWLLGPLMGARVVEVGVPVCTRCRDTLVARQRTGGMTGLVVGAFLGGAAGALLGGWHGEGGQMPLVLGGFVGVFAGTLAGSLLGVHLARRLPVRFRRYSPSRGLVSVRFENPEIAARVLAYLRQQKQAHREGR
jgi:hypothetical protein